MSDIWEDGIQYASKIFDACSPADLVKWTGCELEDAIQFMSTLVAYDIAPLMGSDGDTAVHADTPVSSAVIAGPVAQMVRAEDS